MQTSSCLAMPLVLALLAPAVAASGVGGFVPIPGGEMRLGRGLNQTGRRVRVEPFEILDHPVTNAEYRKFVQETSHPAPLHWAAGTIPAGAEDMPVVFVNRKDVRDFLRWLSAKEGRPCRLPTSVEFEYAARGGQSGKTYPWGDADPEGNANYNTDGSRQFDRWRDYLKPARYGAKNGWGLYGMAGNVAEWIADGPEPSTAGFKYRVEDEVDLEHLAMGGSWATRASYLRCGDRANYSSGIRHPDLGFRPVRQPSGSDWTRQPRRLCAVPLGGDKVHLGWAMIGGDTAATRFNVYRSTERNDAGFRVNASPIAGATDFVDSGLKPGARYQYYVQPLGASGKEGPRSEWAGVVAAAEGDATVARFKPLVAGGQDGGIAPIFGDLNGDGTLDCVTRLANGNRETSQDPGVPVQLEAFTSFGRSLWRRDVCRHDHCYGSANNVPFNVWDMDGDGEAEVVTRLQLGDEVFLAILNGMTGELIRKTPWPPMATDFAKSSTRIHLSIAYLDGKHPAIVTQTGLYENEIFTAYDAQLRRLWQYDSFMETSGSGGHKIEVGDVDGDGRQEVFDGTTCLNSDGTLRWSIYKMHPDKVSLRDHLPDRPGLEVFYIIESNPHAGVYMVDASSGKILWKVNREDDPRWAHGHRGFSADIWEGAAGYESASNRGGHGSDPMVLFSAQGKVILEPFPDGWTPMEWDGDPTSELIRTRDLVVGDFDGKQIAPKREGNPVGPEKAAVLMTADLCGDFRDEIVVLSKNAEGQAEVSVITAVGPIDKRFLAATESLEYRLWIARNMGGGYPSVYTQPLMQPVPR